MEITQLRLENFKIFGKARINFRPLTLLTGTNSSGKSTILNAITAVIQSQAPHLFPFQFVANGKSCSIGSYRDIAHGKNTRTKFSVGLTVTRGENEKCLIDGRYRYSSSGDQVLPDRIAYSSGGDGIELVWKGQDLGYRAIIHSKTHNQMLNKEFMTALKNLFSSMENAKELKGKKNKKERLEDIDEYFSPHEAKWFGLKSRTPHEIVNELRAVQPAGFRTVYEIQRVLENLFNQTAYIGPVRVSPSRYYLTADSDQAIDTSGKNSISLLYEWKKYFPRKYQEVAASIKLLELASRVETKASLDEILKLDVQPFRHSESVSFADVGFGISQVLPILIADTALPKGGTLLVNQPEVHLHPSSQALLGNYFAARLKTRRYILETHSEYLINRLRLLVIEGKLDSTAVSLVFVEPPRKGAKNPKIHSIEIAKDGSLQGAPKSFFETYYLDTFNIAMGGFSNGK